MKLLIYDKLFLIKFRIVPRFNKKPNNEIENDN